MPPMSAPLPLWCTTDPLLGQEVGENCSGAWKRGPESPVGVISLWWEMVDVSFLGKVGSMPLYSVQSPDLPVAAGFPAYNITYSIYILLHVQWGSFWDQSVQTP